MHCAQCGTSNPDAAKFCFGCGTSLAGRCPSCSSEIPDGARFCPACGHRLTDVKAKLEKGARTADPRALARFIPEHLLAKLGAQTSLDGERRIVTMVFCDMKGSTA